MIYGSTPWPIKCIDSYKNALKKRPLAFPFDVGIGKETKDFLKRSLVVEDSKRMSWKELYEHPLIKSKLAGEVAVPVPMTSNVRRLLSKVQHETTRKFIDIIQVFEQYQSLGDLEYDQFSKLMKELNPTITSHEIKLIFSACDSNCNGVIEQDEFQELLCGVNYHLHPLAEKEIDEIVGIICAKEIDLNDLFERFDANKSGTLSLTDFRAMIKYVAPAYEKEMIDVVFNMIDSNKDGYVTKMEFVSCIGGGLVNQKNYVGLWYEKAARNMVTLKNHLSERNLDWGKIMKLVDENGDGQLDIKEFTKLMEIIKFNISQEEVSNIFKVIDTDCSGTISMTEMENFI
jgi:Ca2+-binding EF-hand superfamily protein